MIEFKELFINLISHFLSGKLNREEVAHQIVMELQMDTKFSDNTDLMKNCEWGLRHINEPDYWTTEAELQYYLSCLKGDKVYSSEERDNMLNEIG